MARPLHEEKFLRERLLDNSIEVLTIANAVGDELVANSNVCECGEAPIAERKRNVDADEELKPVARGGASRALSLATCPMVSRHVASTEGDSHTTDSFVSDCVNAGRQNCRLSRCLPRRFHLVSGTENWCCSALGHALLVGGGWRDAMLRFGCCEQLLFHRASVVHGRS